MNRLRNIKLKCCMLLMSIIFFSPAAMPAHAEVGPINEAEAQLEILLDLELQADLGIIDLVPGDTGDLLEICESEDLYIASGDLQEASLRRRVRQFCQRIRDSFKNRRYRKCVKEKTADCLATNPEIGYALCSTIAVTECRVLLE